MYSLDDIQFKLQFKDLRVPVIMTYKGYLYHYCRKVYFKISEYIKFNFICDPFINPPLVK